MSKTGQGDRSERRARRSTRLGILVLIGLAIIVIAIVWGIQNWSEDDDAEGPSVGAPTELLVGPWNTSPAIMIA